MFHVNFAIFCARDADVAVRACNVNFDVWFLVEAFLYSACVQESEYHGLYVRKIIQISIMGIRLNNLFVLVLYPCKSSLQAST